MARFIKPLQLPQNVKQWIEEFHSKTPKQKWEMVFNIDSLICGLVGLRVFRDMQNKWYSYFGAAMSFGYTFLVIYTLWFYFHRGEYLKGMECTYTAGTVTVVGWRE